MTRLRGAISLSATQYVAVAATMARSAPASSPLDLADARRPDASARRRIWEILEVSHCSVIGTCLTLGELRRLARRIGFANEARYTDYEIHALFVERMGEENVVSRAAQKHLDAKFEGAIRKARSLDGADGFLAYWEAAVDTGFVPGAYWALVTHSRLPRAVELQIYSDVHMMSHICGASHRGDARAIAEARRDKADLARRLTGVIAERNDDIRRQRTEIERLTKLVRELQPLAVECGRLRGLMEADERGARLSAIEDEAATLREENTILRQKCARLELRCEHLKARLETLRNPVVSTVQPSHDSQSPDDADTVFEECDAPNDLCGRCLLYVGGRPRTVCRLQQLVASRNGSLLHHDGGVEHSRAILSDLIKRADAVFFPVDYVSHGAADAVKTLCESHRIPYSPLRSASAAAFATAIRKFGRQPEPAAHCSC